MGTTITPAITKTTSSNTIERVVIDMKGTPFVRDTYQALQHFAIPTVTLPVTAEGDRLCQ